MILKPVSFKVCLYRTRPRPWTRLSGFRDGMV